MRIHGVLPALVISCVLSAAYAPTPAFADDAGVLAEDAGAGSGSAAPVPVGGVVPDAGAPPDAGAVGSADPTKSVDATDPESVAKAAYFAITKKDWFMLAGCALAFIGLGVTWLLERKWKFFKSDRVKWATVGVLSGIGALANAWLADEPMASSQTFVGALKVFAFAVFSYVTVKKAVVPQHQPQASSS